MHHTLLLTTKYVKIPVKQKLQKIWRKTAVTSIIHNSSSIFHTISTLLRNGWLICWRSDAGFAQQTTKVPTLQWLDQSRLSYATVTENLDLDSAERGWWRKQLADVGTVPILNTYKYYKLHHQQLTTSVQKINSQCLLLTINRNNAKQSKVYTLSPSNKQKYPSPYWLCLTSFCNFSSVLIAKQVTLCKQLFLDCMNDWLTVITVENIQCNKNWS